MHDPLVVAFEIRRPWPRRQRSPLMRGVRWSVGTSPFWAIAGRWFYFPAWVTVWHREPGGCDSGEVCKHYRRDRSPDGTWVTTMLNGWRFHVHHWRIQVPPLQAIRRRLLTRCTWCGGKHSRTNPVNVAHGWDRDRGPWWRGERSLYHMGCSSVEIAHRTCVCHDPVLDHGDWGHCARCGLLRPCGLSGDHLEKRRILATVPSGHMPSAKRG